MNVCRQRNIIYTIVLGISLASLVQGKMLFGTSAILEFLLQMLCGGFIAWLIRGTMMTKFMYGLLTFVIAYFALASADNFEMAVRNIKYFLALIVGLILSIATSYFLHKDSSEN